MVYRYYARGCGGCVLPTSITWHFRAANKKCAASESKPGPVEMVATAPMHDEISIVPSVTRGQQREHEVAHEGAMRPQSLSVRALPAPGWPPASICVKGPFPSLRLVISLAFSSGDSPPRKLQLFEEPFPSGEITAVADQPDVSSFTGGLPAPGDPSPFAGIFTSLTPIAAWLALRGAAIPAACALGASAPSVKRATPAFVKSSRREGSSSLMTAGALAWTAGRETTTLVGGANASDGEENSASMEVRARRRLWWTLTNRSRG